MFKYTEIYIYLFWISGAYAPLQLALLPADVKSPRGEYVWRDGKVVSWVQPLKETY